MSDEIQRLIEPSRHARGSADCESVPPSTSQQQGRSAAQGGRSNLGVVSIHPVQLLSAQHAAAHSSAAAALRFGAGNCRIDLGLWYACPLGPTLLLHTGAEATEDDMILGSGLQFWP